ncbi:ubiquitin carboxyl-terminal hydrolase 20-like [Galendromus occidentalis]|uniref:Ubiquitin carboxyl-terminal hydrolase n=1 Tax=Galendromus occidentalis TaxID=34638 RepID=A0AAJ7L6D5_9ACAR|nr:ubiquitin carboxyl-terminal hydrolase 20-like [Galendromus occidentalis]
MTRSSCSHVITMGDWSHEEICNRSIAYSCEACGEREAGLWCCLYRECGYVGCGEKKADHSAKHFTKNQEHSLMINLKTFRTWCHTCECEVFLENNVPPLRRAPPNVAHSAGVADERPLGLAGLQNLGNTCYMNAALQALSNCTQLTEYFLNTPNLPLRNNGRGANLAMSYSKMILQMWHEKRPPCVVPSGVAYGINSVCPVFRGPTQQDAQEFLRCFLDQLHDELKNEFFPKKEQDEDEEGAEEHHRANEEEEDEDKEDLYETCDSGLSSEKSEASEKTADNHRSLETSLGSFLIGELKKVISSPVPRGDLKRPTPSYRSIISDVFDGRMLSSVQCFTCETVSSTEEVFQDLSLPIPSRYHLNRLHHGPSDADLTSSSTSLNSLASSQGQQGWMDWLLRWLYSWVWGPSVSLTDCLAAFFSADELEGDNMYSCGKCNKLRNGVKYSKPMELPEVLCIHLKRFRHELMFSTKISSYVQFPLEGLDMTPFTHPHARDKVTTYELTAVICHHGTAGMGHYICYAMNDCDGQWYEYDDVYVTQVEASTVANCEAYVLFYRKYSEEMLKRRLHTADLVDRSQCEHGGGPSFYISRRWVNRFNTFAEPGPIDNEDFVCCHGKLDPLMANRVTQEDFLLFSQSVWEYLRETFRGGPALTSIEPCAACLGKRRAFIGKKLAEIAAGDVPLISGKFAPREMRFEQQQFLQNPVHQQPSAQQARQQDQDKKNQKSQPANHRPADHQNENTNCSQEPRIKPRAEGENEEEETMKDDDEVLTLESPAIQTDDHLFDKVASDRVAKLTMTVIDDNNDIDTETDSAFCSPLNSVTSQSIVKEIISGVK